MSKRDEVVFYLIYVENMKNKWKWMMVSGLLLVVAGGIFFWIRSDRAATRREMILKDRACLLGFTKFLHCFIGDTLQGTQECKDSFTPEEEAFVTQCSSYFIQNYELSKCSRKRVKKLASLAELPSADQYSTLYTYGCMLSTLYDF